jgi:hypothetical protein
MQWATHGRIRWLLLLRVQNEFLNNYSASARQRFWFNQNHMDILTPRGGQRAHHNFI